MFEFFFLSLQGLLTRSKHIDRRLQRDLKAFRESESGIKWIEERKELPVYQIKGQIINTLKKENAMVVSGDTGCGKTTQVLLKLFRTLSLSLASLLH